MSNQGLVQESIRATTGTELDYNGDWSALFDQDGIPEGDWNGRLLTWINQTIDGTFDDLPRAMQEFAEFQGYFNWSSMGAITLASAAESLAGTEQAALALDFTDNRFAGSTGHYGSAYIRNNSDAEAFLGDETDGLVIDFMDDRFVADDGHYGSAFIRESN